jgi:hypothetical protein
MVKSLYSCCIYKLCCDTTTVYIVSASCTQVQFKPGLVFQVVVIKALILAGVRKYHF